ncbi:hypothetical protein [Prosthecobacter sp.]|uniref:hypothetical protein n=1 Tax=Prosthecobacter sp. TaxID=1965333 RepID=UPI0037834E6E
MILEITASTNGGFCGQCVKTQRAGYRLRPVTSFFKDLVGLVVFPFGVLAWVLRTAWLHWRFPFDRSALRTAIRAGMGDEDFVWSYLDGVVEGYWKSTPANQAMFTSNRARLYGEEDGGRLRRGEIAVSDIPTRRPPWMSEAN